MDAIINKCNEMGLLENYDSENITDNEIYDEIMGHLRGHAQYGNYFLDFTKAQAILFTNIMDQTSFDEIKLATRARLIFMIFYGVSKWHELTKMFSEYCEA